MIVEKDFTVVDKKCHLLLKTFKDCDWAGSKYLIIIDCNDQGILTHIASWSDEFGFHVYAPEVLTSAVPTMKEVKILLLKHLIDS